MRVHTTYVTHITYTQFIMMKKIYKKPNEKLKGRKIMKM